MLELEFIESPQSCYDQIAEPLLRAGVMPNNMVVGVAYAAATATVPNPAYLGLVAREGGTVVGAVISSKAGWISFSQCSESVARALLARWLERMEKPRCMFGPEPTISKLMQWAEGTYGMKSVGANKNLAYELLKVDSPTRPAAGAMRLATLADAPLLVDWEVQFVADCKLPGASEPDFRENCVALVDRLLKNGNGQIALWEVEGKPVAMCRRTRSAPFGTSVSGVYTPRELRGHGYASHLVARFSQMLLDEGAPRCLLFTDADNPTSNGIYQAIGYRYCCDFFRYDF
jgi:GNAT superfamily N-acetyltransferase